jgi:hypothetical protein
MLSPYACDTIPVRRADNTMVTHIAWLEDTLAALYQKAPPLPRKVKTWVVRWLPWGSLIGGFLALLSIWTIWELQRVWIAVLILSLEVLLYLGAFPYLRLKKKRGWNYLFYAALVNVLYGCTLAFTPLGGPSSIVGSMLSSALSLYLLYQIREYYDGKRYDIAGR